MGITKYCRETPDSEWEAALGFRNSLLEAVGIIDKFTPEELAGVIPPERLLEVQMEAGLEI